MKEEAFANNYELQLAYQFIQYTNNNLFLTGNAGTGKTTFLQYLRFNCKKKLIVVAPTGIAALNAHGETIHSFFQLPFSPFIPINEEIQQKEYSSSNKYRFYTNKIKIIRALELLIIDEISMVRADTLDAIDNILKYYRHNDKPFGGVQLLMIGDLHQLPPIVTDDIKDIINKYYDNEFFFSSYALKKSQLKVIELKHIYRQTDSNFINILNEIRNNHLSNTSIDILNERYNPNILRDIDNQYYIILTTHKNIVDSINNNKLENLRNTYNTIHEFQANIIDDFPEKIYPNEATLKLAVGAQVMFIKNDPSFEKLYYNGKIGIIKKIEDMKIYVECDEDIKRTIVVTPTTWVNFKYTINETTNEIEEVPIGTFEQYPLKLAWAITIHKSQGLTFNKAIIDIGKAFAPGQVYVALSRCRNLDGIILASEIYKNTIKPINSAIKIFEESITTPNINELEHSKLNYKKDFILELFNFNSIQSLFNSIKDTYTKNYVLFNNNYLDIINTIDIDANKSIFNPNNKFIINLNNSLIELKDNNDDSSIQESIFNVANYYIPLLDKIFIQKFKNLYFNSEDTKLTNIISKLLLELELILIQKINIMKEICENGFDIINSIRIANITENNFIPAFNQPITIRTLKNLDLPNYELYTILLEWRKSQAEAEKISSSQLYKILSQKTLKELSIFLPYNTEQLKKINGIGSKKINKYGNTILKIIDNYCNKYNIYRDSIL